MNKSAVATAQAVAEVTLAALLSARVEDEATVGWPAWALTDPSIPSRMAVDDVTLYNGDAGIAWALAGLGRALGREELSGLASRAAERVLANVDSLPGEGLLAGRAGAALAAYSAGLPGSAGLVLAHPTATDLTDGAAGVLLAQVRTDHAPDPLLVRALARRATAQQVGWAWADTASDGLAQEGGRGGRAPLLGLAHGASGVALALVESAAVAPELRPALALAAGGLAWESGWFDPLQGWPDLRGDESTYPVWWCHGAAGMTAVRLRLLELAEAGVDLGMPVASLRAHAHAGLQLCTEHVEAAVASASAGELPPAGLTLCHGLGGALDALGYGSQVTGNDAHRQLAAEALGRVAGVMGEDPLQWPSGTREPGSSSLFLGLAGVAMVAARLAWPEAGVPCPSLLR
jgi:lantibiotic modifying enzyme